VRVRACVRDALPAHARSVLPVRVQARADCISLYSAECMSFYSALPGDFCLWFLVSCFWFRVQGLGFVRTHVLCDARREAAIGHLLPEILKSQRPGIITLYGSNCIMTFQNFTFLADATWGLTKMAPAPTRVAPSICLRPRTLALIKKKEVMMESG